MDHATLLAQPNDGEALRLSPLAAFVAWVANLLRTLAGMKRRKVFPPNWQDHWDGLRQLEWCWDQMFAASAKHVLSGGSLDQDIGFELLMEVPANYGRPCPSTPQEMNRRFIHQQRLKLDPEKYILRHIRRIAKRAGIQLDISPSGCPLRRAASPDAPHWRKNGSGLFPPPRKARARRHASSRGPGNGREPALIAQARAPPGCLLPIAHCLSAPARLRSPLRA